MDKKNRYSGMTRAMMVNEIVQARIRKDGGPLARVDIFWNNGSSGSEYYDPATAEQIAFDVRYNGGTAIVTRVR